MSRRRKRPSPQGHPADRPAPPPEPADKLGPWLFRLALVSQAITVLITWPAWNVREQPVNLPMFEAPAISFGWLVLASLAVAAFFPKPGVAAHALVVIVACVFDQYRVQPQIFSLIVLMWGCIAGAGAWFARWYLAAMWLWAGIHKLLSPEWFGCLSWEFVEDCGLDPEGTHVWFAAGAAATEIALGIAAILDPRRAAFGCFLFHMGVLAALSPFFGDHNASVWPWNFTTAVVGPWLLRRPQPALSQMAKLAAWRQVAVLAALFIIPAGYYTGWVNPHWAFVLYSGQLPHALHTSPKRTVRLDGWTGLTVPVPDSPRLFLQKFRRTARPGDKLHIYDPRRRSPNRFYVMDERGEAMEIARERFHAQSSGQVGGVEIESRNAVWKLRRAGARFVRDEEGLIASVTVGDEESLASLVGLPNLREVKIEGAKLAPDSLSFARELPRLEIVHFEDCDVAAGGLPGLGKLEKLEVLRLPDCGIDDGAMKPIAALDGLIWLDLAGNAITGRGLIHLAALDQCEWLDLSRTQIRGDKLGLLADMAALETLQLSETSIGDEALAPLEKLQQIRRLDLTKTRVTEDGAARLRKALPNCRIAR
jgi:hypothetical protein